MSHFIVNDVVPRVQYTAAAGEDEFTYPFEIFEDEDLLVYLTPEGQTPDQNTDLLTLDVDYAVTGAGDQGGGFITLTDPATLDDTITIIRDVPMDRDSDYTTGGPFTAQSINHDLDRIIMLIQQVNALLTTRGLLYNANEILTAGDTTLPKLAANTGVGIPMWTKNASGNLVAALLDEDIDASTLRSELASETELAPGSEIVGHYELDAGGGTTVNDELIRQNALIASTEADVEELILDSDFHNVIMGGDFSINPWQRGTSFVSIANNIYTADRFKYLKVGAMVHDVTRSTSIVPTTAQAGLVSTGSLLVTCTTADAAIAAGDYCAIRTTVEGYHFLKIAQNAFMFSFWVYSTKTGIHCVSFGNSGSDRVYIAEYTVALSNTWQFVSIPVSASPAAGTWDYTNGVGLNVSFALAAGTTFHGTADVWNTADDRATVNQVNVCDTIGNLFAVNLIQAVPGVNVPAFNRRSFGQDLMAFHRYYKSIYTASGCSSSSTDAIMSFPFSPYMRAAPTFAISAAVQVTNGTADFVQSAPSALAETLLPESATINFNDFVGLTSTQGLVMTNVEGHVNFDADFY